MENKVTSGKPRVGGAIYRAPLGTELPKDATSKLNEAFKSLGYCSEDGLTNTMSLEMQKTKAWGGDTVFETQLSFDDEYQFKLIEAMDEEVLKAYYGDNNVTGNLESGIKIEVDGSEQQYCSWVVDLVLKDGILKRIVIPCAKITEKEEIVYNGKDPIGYGIKLGAIKGDGKNTHIEYLSKGDA